MTRVSISPNPPGAALARFVRGLRYGDGFARENYPDQPHVAEALSAVRVKTTVPGRTTANEPSLSALGVLDAAATQLLAGSSALEAIRPFTPTRLFGIPFARDVDAATAGDWVREGVSMPLSAGLFDTVKLAPFRLGSIVALDDEVLRAKGTDAVIRDKIFRAQGRLESSALLDPLRAASAYAPASLTNTGTFIPWTDPATTFAAMLAAITTSGAGLRWLARPRDLAAAAAAFGFVGAANLPGALLGLPVVPVPFAPAGVIALVDLAEVPLAAADIVIDVSDQSAVEMADDPTNAITDYASPEAPVSTQLVSLWQSGASAFKVSRLVNWAPRSGACAFTNISGSPAS